MDDEPAKRPRVEEIEGALDVLADDVRHRVEVLDRDSGNKLIATVRDVDEEDASRRFTASHIVVAIETPTGERLSVVLPHRRFGKWSRLASYGGE